MSRHRLTETPSTRGGVVVFGALAGSACGVAGGVWLFDGLPLSQVFVALAGLVLAIAGITVAARLITANETVDRIIGNSDGELSRDTQSGIDGIRRQRIDSRDGQR